MAENKQQGTVKRKIPERQCMGCNEKKPKNELLRVVRTPDGSIELDFTGKKPGRGAYICRNAACLKKAQKTGRLGRTLDSVIPEEVYKALGEELENAE